jgi:cytochrome c oxidase subunit I+III
MAAGIALFMVGLTIFYPLAIVGGIIVVLGVLKVFKDGKEDKFQKAEQEGEKWPFQALPKMKLGVWVFLMSEIVLFGSLMASYAFVRLNSTSWPSALQVHNTTIGTANTIILLTSSLAMILSLYYIRAGSLRGLKIGLISTFVLGATFLVLKLGVEWPELYRKGFTISSGLPASTYYALTGVHAVHVAVGLAAVGYLMVRAFTGGLTVDKHGAVEYVGLYWHYIDIVWMFLFTMFYLI